MMIRRSPDGKTDADAGAQLLAEAGGDENH